MSVERRIRRAIGDLAEAWNRRDGDSFVRLFAEDADYITAAGVRLSGRARLVEELFPIERAASPPGPVSMEVETIRVLAPGAAVALCSWRMAGAQREPAAREGLVTLVFREEGGAWRIVALHNTGRKG